MASKGQVLGVVSSAMLSGNDVFYMKSKVGVIPLVNSAILTTVFSTLTNAFPGLVVHYEIGEPETRERAFKRISATKSMYSMYLSCSGS